MLCEYHISVTLVVGFVGRTGWRASEATHGFVQVSFANAAAVFGRGRVGGAFRVGVGRRGDDRIDAVLLFGRQNGRHVVIELGPTSVLVSEYVRLVDVDGQDDEQAARSYFDAHRRGEQVEVKIRRVVLETCALVADAFVIPKQARTVDDVRQHDRRRDVRYEDVGAAEDAQRERLKLFVDQI